MLHLRVRQGDLKVLIDSLEQVAERHRLLAIDNNGTPEGGHVADLARHDNHGCFGVGDGVFPDTRHIDDDVIGCQSFCRGGVFRDVPVDQRKMGIVGVGDDMRREMDGDVAGPVKRWPRSRGPLGHRTWEGMATCESDGRPGTERVRE